MKRHRRRLVYELLLFIFLAHAPGYSWAQADDQFTRAAQSLKQIAASSLNANIVSLKSGSYLVAGQHQFKTLWTRDFCFSIRGLLAIGREDVVRNHLEALFKKRRKSDGLIPRVLDSMPIQARVMLSLFGISTPIHEPLIASFYDEHGSSAIDSNALFLLGAMDYVQASGDLAWWEKHESGLVQIFKYYSHLRRGDGLVVQSPFSDWQDSVSRAGVTFYSNILYFRVLTRLVENPAFQINPEDVRKFGERLDEIFWDSKEGMYRSMEGENYFSLDGNLFALDWGFGKSLTSQYALLKSSRLWSGKLGLPGMATTPEYPEIWKAVTNLFAGLGGYHDQIYWSWLMAYSAKMAHRMGDDGEAQKILTTLSALAERDGYITEIYSPKAGLPKFRSWLYSSETPFSWGSAFVLDTLADLKEL